MQTILSTFSYFLVFMLLAALAWRDLKEHTLPDTLNTALALSFLFFHVATHWQFVKPAEALLGCLAGGGLLAVIRTLTNKFYMKDSLGLGDIKLMAAAGLGIGLPDIFMALSLGAFIALLHGLGLSVAERKNNHKVKLGQIHVPAGPGLAVGIALTALYRFGFPPFLHG